MIAPPKRVVITVDHWQLEVDAGDYEPQEKYSYLGEYVLAPLREEVEELWNEHARVASDLRGFVMSKDNFLRAFGFDADA